jgi:hypothetical protein
LIIWRAAARGDEVGDQPVGDGAGEVGRGHVDQRGALHVAAVDQVERDVDAAGLGGHGLRVRVDGRLVEGVEDGHLGGAAGGGDVRGDRVDGCPRPPGQENLGPFSGEGPGGGAADAPAGSVDDGVLVLKQHLCLLVETCRLAVAS